MLSIFLLFQHYILKLRNKKPLINYTIPLFDLLELNLYETESWNNREDRLSDLSKKMSGLILEFINFIYSSKYYKLNLCNNLFFSVLEPLSKTDLRIYIFAIIKLYNLYANETHFCGCLNKSGLLDTFNCKILSLRKNLMLNGSGGSNSTEIS